MTSISIAAYTVRVRKKRSLDYERLGNFDGVTSFCSTLEVFLKTLSKAHAHDELAQSLQLAERVKRKGFKIFGILQAGEYGYASDIIDVPTMQQAHRRAASEAELYPFFFLFSADDDAEIGIMLFQRHGIRGVYTVFTKEFRAWFDEKYSGYTIELRRLVPVAVLEELADGRVKSFEVTTHTVPSDVADKLIGRGNLKHVGLVTVKVEAKKNKFLSGAGWLKRINKGKTYIAEIPESIQEIEGRVRATIEYHGTQRVVDFSRPESLTPYIDCTNEVEMIDGHPTFSSIYSYSNGLLAELQEQLGIS